MRFCCVLALLCLSGFGGEKKLKMKDLPVPAQRVVDQLAKTATVIGFAKEIEDGRTTYEIETKLNGMTRDVSVDPEGRIVSVEEQVAIGTIPAAARTAIEKAASGGSVVMVEKVTEGGNVKYEATIKPASGKKREVAFTAEGARAN